MVLSLTHVVHNLTILLGLIHLYGNLADITPMEYTTRRFVRDGISMLILFQILSLALNFCILIYIVQSMAGRNNDMLLLLIFGLVNEACWRSKCTQMFGRTLVSQELAGGNIRFVELLRRESWWIISVSTWDPHSTLSSIWWLNHTTGSRSNIDSRPILVSHVISFPPLLVILLLSIIPVIANEDIIVVYSLL